MKSNYFVYLKTPLFAIIFWVLFFSTLLMTRYLITLVLISNAYS